MCSADSEFRVNAIISCKGKPTELSFKSDGDYKSIVKILQDTQVKINEALTAVIEEEKLNNSSNGNVNNDEAIAQEIEDEDDDDENSESMKPAKRRKSK
ncbi:hypothetical protein CHUAL_009464 [Chamberlinius hualienensis]